MSIPYQSTACIERSLVGQTKLSVRTVIAAGIVVCLSVTAGLTVANADASRENTRVWHIEGKAATGPNDVCGVPQWSLPAPFGPAHFTFLGEYDPTPGALDAIDLSAANCDPSILLATTVDPNFQAFFGFPDADARLKNLPLRKVWTIAGFDAVRAELPPFGSVPPNPWQPTTNKSDKPITLGDWLKARSRLKIQCFRNGGAKVEARFSNLVPNGLYGLYGIWKTQPPGFSQPTFMPVAFGGFPHLITASNDGEAAISRQLNYCPKDGTPDGSVLMLVDLAYHADGIGHGVFPFTPAGMLNFRDADGSVFESPEPPGIVTHVQVSFPINVEPLVP